MDIDFKKIIQGFVEFNELSDKIGKLPTPIRDIESFEKEYPTEYKEYKEMTSHVPNLCYDDWDDVLPFVDYDGREPSFDFVNKLISFGGSTVEDISFDSMEELLNQYGQLWYKDILSRNDFGGNDDYFETFASKIEENEEWILCYGYALFENGSWKAVQWYINKVNGSIFDESSVPKVAYFGIMINMSIDYLVNGIDHYN